MSFWGIMNYVAWGSSFILVVLIIIDFMKVERSISKAKRKA